MKPFLLRTAAVIPVYFGLLLGLYQTSSQEVNCSVGWIENGSSCYYVYNDTEQRLTFWEAKRWCKQQGHSCQLTSVLSQEENDFLDYLINEAHLPPNETFYIGLKKNNNQGKWRWIDDQPYNYTNWFQGQEPPPESKGNCAFYKGDVHQWGQELKCSKTERLFICKQQKHSVVESVINSSQENISSSTPVKLTLTTIASPTFVNSTQWSPTVLLQLREQWTVEKLNELLASLEGASFTDESAERLTKELAAVLDGLLNTSQTETKSQSVAQITKVIEMSEKIGKFIVEGLKRGGNITEPKNIQIQTRNLALGVDILPPASSANTTESVSFPQDNRTANKINLPASLLWKAQQSDGVSITSLLLPNIGVSKDPQAKRILNSGIVSSTILFNNGSKFNNLREPVTINLSTVKEGKGEGSRHCVFLDITTNPPSWSSLGCVVHHQSASHTECHCYHMTSYAVLMDVHGAYESDAISEEHELALSTVSIVGCLIAFVCYIILLCTFYFLRRRTETSSIHMNLAAAESFAIFFFLVAYPAVSIKEACFAIAVLLYYFQLASFCWMLVEGINLLRGLVKVFRVTSRLRIYCLFAWGLPVLLAVVIPGVFHHQYLRDNFCWISHELIWAFAGPVAFILAVNLSVLIVAIKIVVRRARYKVKPNENSKMPGIQLEIRAAFKTTVILVPLLGVTWLLGFISIHEESLVFQYLFAVINSMQGVYFLIAQYCFDDDIKKNAYQASTRMKRLFSLSSTKSTGSSSDRRSRTFSDKKSGSVMRPNLVSPQKSTGGPENNADGLVIAKNRSNEDNFELSLQGMENQQNKEGIADGDNDEDLFDCPQQSAEDQPNIERELVPPQESSSDNNKERNLPYRQESSAYQQTDEDQQNSEETSICPQHSIADRKDNQKENFLFHKKSSDDHQTDGENFDPTRQVTVEQQDDKETSGGPQQSNADQGNDANDFAGQADNQDNSVPPSSAAQWDNEGKVESQSTANEDKNKNKSSPHEEQQYQQYNEENLPSHCQNEADQLQQSNEESLVSSQPTNHCTDQRKDQNNTVVTRF